MKFDRGLLGSVTVWYNPESGFVDNIKSYADISGLLVVVDNSLESNEALFNTIEHANKLYIWNAENMGIAKALNQGLKVLLTRKYKFALTLDQDSSFKNEELEKLLTAAANLDYADVGILSPIHVQQNGIANYYPTAYTPLTCVMTSGNILNLEIAETIGFFKEELFIDHVDNEYCLRLHKRGFKVLAANSFLTHELGKEVDACFMGKRVGSFISHSPQRLYFFVRNSIYILSKYFFVDFGYTLMEITSLLKRFAKLFFEDRPVLRLKLYFKGIWDYRKLK